MIHQVKSLLLALWLALCLPILVSSQSTVTSCPVAQQSYAALLAGCPTPSKFCQDILSRSTIVPISTYKYVTKYNHPHHTSTYTYASTYKYVTRYKTTIQSVIPVTLYKGRQTTTTQACNSLATCGSFRGAARGDLREACSCIFPTPTVTTSTYTYTRNNPTSYVYNATSTYLYTYVKTTTVYDPRTKVLPTVTAYECSTAAAPAQTCDNAGHQYARYFLTKKDVNQPLYKWNIDDYRTQKPSENGTATLLGAELDIYYEDYNNDYPSDITLTACNGTYINDRGYIYAPQTGQYRFSIPAYAQAAYIWVGDKAISGYDVSNADVKADQKNDLHKGGPVSLIRLEQGKYYPLRIAWRCISSEFDFYIQIVQPDGHIMHGQYAPTHYYDDDGTFYAPYYDYYGNEYLPNTVKIFSDYIVQFGCGADESLAPQWPDWGSEP